jgi:hypothetical protein
VDVQDPPGKALQERCRQKLHEAGENDQLDSPLGQPVRQLLVAALPRVELHGRKGRCLDPGLRCPVERPRLGVVGRDGNDRQIRLQQRLQIRSLATDEDADQRISPMTRPPAA